MPAGYAVGHATTGAARGRELLEPQSTALFILLVLIFFALVAGVAVAKHPAVRVLAAVLAFLPAMLFGVAAVNKYYGYYQTWGAMAADLTGQGLGVPAIPRNASPRRVNAILSHVSAAQYAPVQGETVRLLVPGRSSHITRTTYVYLPPQYFQRSFERYRFPAIELINGYPGQPQDWISVLGVTTTYQRLLHDHVARPAVLVMPDPNGGTQISLQCLNVVHGPQDATYLAVDLQEYLARTLRVQPSGRAWGIAGYSEGGYCAANLALRYHARYGFAGVLSGYFRPSGDRLGRPPRTVDPFDGNVRLRLMNSPLTWVRTVPLSVRLPQFWLGAGGGNREDVAAAHAFQQGLLLRQPDLPVHLTAGGGHTMTTWRALMPSLLEWMTPRLGRAAAYQGREAPAKPGPRLAAGRPLSHLPPHSRPLTPLAPPRRARLLP